MLRARGPRPAAQVWEDYALPQRWPAWSPQILAVDASAERIAPGVTGTVHVPGLRVPFRVTAVDEATRTWRWVVAVGPFTAGLEHRVVAVPAGTVTDLRIEAAAPLAAAYGPVAWLALRRLVSR